MDKLVRAAILLDYYGALLSSRQREALSLRYESDLSFSEIAENLGITRQGAHDISRRALCKLEQIELQLGHIRRNERLLARLSEIARLAEDLPENSLRARIIELTELSDEELFGG